MSEKCEASARGQAHITGTDNRYIHAVLLSLPYRTIRTTEYKRPMVPKAAFGETQAVVLREFASADADGLEVPDRIS